MQGEWKRRFPLGIRGKGNDLGRFVFSHPCRKGGDKDGAPDLVGGLEMPGLKPGFVAGYYRGMNAPSPSVVAGAWMLLHSPWWTGHECSFSLRGGRGMNAPSFSVVDWA